MYNTVMYTQDHPISPQHSRFYMILQYLTDLYCTEYCTVCFPFISSALAKPCKTMFSSPLCVYCSLQLAQHPIVQDLWYALDQEKDERRAYQRRYERTLGMK